MFPSFCVCISYFRKIWWRLAGVHFLQLTAYLFNALYYIYTLLHIYFYIHICVWSNIITLFKPKNVFSSKSRSQLKFVCYSMLSVITQYVSNTHAHSRKQKQHFHEQNTTETQRIIMVKEIKFPRKKKKYSHIQIIWCEWYCVADKRYTQTIILLLFLARQIFHKTRWW